MSMRVVYSNLELYRVLAQPNNGITRSPKQEHSAYIHAIGDLIQSVGVCIAGALIWWRPDMQVISMWRAKQKNETFGMKLDSTMKFQQRVGLGLGCTGCARF